VSASGPKRPFVVVRATSHHDWRADQILFPGAIAEQEIDRLPSHVFVGQGDRGEARPQVGGRFVIVERHDGDVVWHA